MTTRWFDRVNALLKAKGLTRVIVGKALGISPQAVSLKLSGKRPTSVVEIEVIAGLMGMTGAELVMGDEQYMSSSDEFDLVLEYRRLPAEQQAAFRALLRATGKLAHTDGDVLLALPSNK